MITVIHDSALYKFTFTLHLHYIMWGAGSILISSTFLACVTLCKLFTHIAQANSVFHPSAIIKLSTIFGRNMVKIITYVM